MEDVRRVMAGFRGRARPRSGPSNGERAAPWLARGTRRSAAGDWAPSDRKAFVGIGLCTKPAGEEERCQPRARPKDARDTRCAILLHACQSRRSAADTDGCAPSAGRLRTVSVDWRLSRVQSSSRATGLDREGRRVSVGEGSLGESRPGRGEVESMVAAGLRGDGSKGDVDNFDLLTRC